MQNLLLLCPADPCAAPDHGAFLARLRDAQFLGAAMGDHFFKPGDGFFEFVTFLGCSPVVALGEPGATAEICRIEWAPPLPQPHFFSGANLKPPRCPACGFRAPDPHAVGAAWQADPQARWRCPGCGGEFAAPALKWRHSAGFGRCALRIWGVFEGEAVASDRLLDLLREFHPAWQSFYLQLRA